FAVVVLPAAVSELELLAAAAAVALRPAVSERELPVFAEREPPVAVVASVPAGPVAAAGLDAAHFVVRLAETSGRHAPPACESVVPAEAPGAVCASSVCFAGASARVVPRPQIVAAVPPGAVVSFAAAGFVVPPQLVAADPFFAAVWPVVAAELVVP